MYLLVDREHGLAQVPEPLLARFGTPIEAFAFQMTPERRLARADAGAVLHAIAERGYYLQLPPTPELRRDE
jgi:uncharacterized protein